MCGFVGFASPDQSYDRNAAVHAMADLIVHRGPDSDGYFIDERVALGFRRLSIIDLTCGDQPLYNEDGTVVLCFNGEIYNYQEIRAELVARGHVFKTNADSEVLVHGYEEFTGNGGKELLEKLRGMFAFVIYDRKRNRLFGARDTFGIKPFYYYQRGGTLLFASEIKAFLAHPSFEKRLNERMLPLYLCFEYLPNDETLFEGVKKLPAAHCFTWQQGQMTVECYKSLIYQLDERPNLDEWAERISMMVHDSCNVHQIADVEVGSFLSAGVDSSLIAYETSKNMDVRTFSVGYAEEKYSELEAAHELAQAIGVRNTGRKISAQDFFDAVPAVQYHMDEPLPNPSAIPLYYLAQFAAEEVKVVVSGEGADELFGGYPYYQECLTYEPYMKVPQPVRSLLGNAAAKLPAFHGRRFLMRGRYPLSKRYIRNNYVFNFEDTPTFLKHAYDVHHPEYYSKSVFDQVKGEDEVTQMQYADIKLWLQDDILQKADKMSMAHSLELRVPFLDNEVLALALAIPSRYRVTKEQTKVALRLAAQKVLPKKTSQMPKIGFITPLNDWLKDERFASRVRAQFNSESAQRYFQVDAINRLLDDHVAGHGLNMKKIWTIYCFLVWYDEFFVKR